MLNVVMLMLAGQRIKENLGALLPLLKNLFRFFKTIRMLVKEIVPAEGIPVAAADDSDVPRPKESLRFRKVLLMLKARLIRMQVF